MAEVIDIKVIHLPSLKIAGQEIQHHLQGENKIPQLWEECFKTRVFERIESFPKLIYNRDYVGYMFNFDKEMKSCTYVCGLLMDTDYFAPYDMVAYPIAESQVVVTQIKGQPKDVFANAHRLTVEKALEFSMDLSSASWCMELYNCPRFTTPDEKGEIIMDYYVELRKL